MGSATPQPEKTSAEQSGGEMNGAQAKFGASGDRLSKQQANCHVPCCRLAGEAHWIRQTHGGNPGEDG